jgi:hypothetical protein
MRGQYNQEGPNAGIRLLQTSRRHGTDAEIRKDATMKCILVGLTLAAAPLLFAGDPQLVRNLNAQLGKTVNTIAVEPFYAKDARKIPREIRPSECRPVGWMRSPDWHYCVIEMRAIPRVFPASGGSSWVDALGDLFPNYTHTTTDPVIISTPDGPVRVPSVTTTTETPRAPRPTLPWAPGHSDWIDLWVYFAVDNNSTRVGGWLAYYCVIPVPQSASQTPEPCRTNVYGAPIQPSEWNFVDSRQVVRDNHGRIRLASMDGENHENWWFGIHEVRR